MIKHHSAVITISLILLSVFFFNECISNEKNDDGTVTGFSYHEYSGSASCMKCHRDVYDAHVKTAHFKTSSIASGKTLLGSFNDPYNKYLFPTGAMVVMEKKGDSFYQVAYINSIETKRQRFDLVIGSGTKGQSFASWAGDKLVQMPITYFTSAHQWSNSPGYPGRIAFNRPITSRCLECHSTYAEKISAEGIEPESFDKNKILLGVDCEKCHGPGAEHVKFQTNNPDVKNGKFIINPATFTRQQTLDLCALCHGGRLDKIKPSFEFTAGDKLADYFRIDTAGRNINAIDVHGNQLGLLQASKCFQKTTTLSCITCHNSHENEKGNVSLFSQRCISCHNSDHTGIPVCKMTASLGETTKKDCISCHMPEQPSMAISVLLQGNPLPVPATMHTHWITIYPDATKKMLSQIKNRVIEKNK
ncbi:MAG: hypothetical protein B6D37_01505 [Sphingobacteriales bacterium UTBCD1]|jgi:nitrate/TMAO reductase-like tetraheme cytochrome c subunit|nr:MAG: hypothetical protein B6D37_01505 [Sphingobacteriales bacterium UTBCD1]